MSPAFSVFDIFVWVGVLSVYCRLTRGRLVPAFIQYKPEPPPPDLKERPLTRRPLSKHSNRIPVGFRDKVGHFVDPKFNPNDRYYGENVEGLIDSIMGVPVGTVR